MSFYGKLRASCPALDCESRSEAGNLLLVLILFWDHQDTTVYVSYMYFISGGKIHTIHVFYCTEYNVRFDIGGHDECEREKRWNIFDLRSVACSCFEISRLKLAVLSSEIWLSPIVLGNFNRIRYWVSGKPNTLWSVSVLIVMERGSSVMIWLWTSWLPSVDFPKWLLTLILKSFALCLNYGMQFFF